MTYDHHFPICLSIRNYEGLSKAGGIETEREIPKFGLLLVLQICDATLTAERKCQCLSRMQGKLVTETQPILCNSLSL
jgi:hypothetical protein